MLKQPDFVEPNTEGRSCVCLEDGKYHAYLDQDAAITLLYGLHSFYDQNLGEEIDIPSNHWDELPQRGKFIGYCEFNMSPSHLVKKQGKNILKAVQPIVRYKPHGVYSPENDRLDYFVSPEEVRAAYEALTLALENSQDKRSNRQVILFDTLTVHLILPQQHQRP